MIRIQNEDFDVGAEIAGLRAATKEVGAIVTFTGLVRETGEEEKVQGLFLEHYPGMTESSIQTIVDEATNRWGLLGVRVIHRIGNLDPAEQIVFVAVSSSHRGEAFSAAEFIMDYLKTQAPFWKKERTDTGGEWLGTRERDAQAASKW